MGEVIDLEVYRRQRKRRLVETNAAAKRRKAGRQQPNSDRTRPAAEPVDIGHRRAEPAAEAKPGDKSSD